MIGAAMRAATRAAVWSRRSFALLLTAFLFAASLLAADTRVVTLTAGRGELLQFEHDIIKVVIAEPKIADAVVACAAPTWTSPSSSSPAVSATRI